MAYLVFIDKSGAIAAQAKRDVVLGYPESLDSLRWVGGGRHCPKEFGRALHYCRLFEHKDGDQWAITDVKEVAAEPEATKQDNLDGWFSVITAK